MTPPPVFSSLIPPEDVSLEFDYPNLNSSSVEASSRVTWQEARTDRRGIKASVFMFPADAHVPTRLFFFIPSSFPSTSSSASCHSLAIIAPPCLHVAGCLLETWSADVTEEEIESNKHSAYQGRQNARLSTKRPSLDKTSSWIKRRWRCVALSVRLEWGTLRPVCLARLSGRNGFVWLTFCSRFGCRHLAERLLKLEDAGRLLTMGHIKSEISLTATMIMVITAHRDPHITRNYLDMRAPAPYGQEWSLGFTNVRWQHCFCLPVHQSHIYHGGAAP